MDTSVYRETVQGTENASKITGAHLLTKIIVVSSVAEPEPQGAASFSRNRQWYLSWLGI
jgi:hypothetical protein